MSTSQPDNKQLLLQCCNRTVAEKLQSVHCTRSCSAAAAVSLCAAQNNKKQQLHIAITRAHRTSHSAQAVSTHRTAHSVSDCTQHTAHSATTARQRTAARTAHSAQRTAHSAHLDAAEAEPFYRTTVAVVRVDTCPVKGSRAPPPEPQPAAAARARFWPTGGIAGCHPTRRVFAFAGGDRRAADVAARSGASNWPFNVQAAHAPALRPPTAPVGDCCCCCCCQTLTHKRYQDP